MMATTFSPGQGYSWVEKVLMRQNDLMIPHRRSDHRPHQVHQNVLPLLVQRRDHAVRSRP
jgi:hypothetical protein